MAETLPKSVAEVEKALDQQIAELQKTCGNNTLCFPLLMTEDHIDAKLVDKVYDRLMDLLPQGNPDGKLIVVLHSSGGDIDAAFNIAQLLRRYAPTELEFVVPRWAKSAATLLACAGDKITMTPVAELGPLDPQITQMNPMEQRLERFSPLHIESTLELIRNEFRNGNKELAEGLLQRLQFPLTLGSFKKSLELGIQYLEKLLTTRMLKDQHQKAKEVAKRLTEGYADHGFCINIEEARAIGLNVQEMDQSQLALVWKIHKLVRRRSDLEAENRRKEMAKKLKDIPAELLDNLPPELLPQGATANGGKR